MLAQLGDLALGAARDAGGALLGHSLAQDRYRMQVGDYPRLYRYQREHYRAGIGDRASQAGSSAEAATLGTIDAAMSRGATITEALGVPSGGGGAAGGGMLGNASGIAAQQQRLGTQQALMHESRERERDRQVERERIQAQRDIATGRVDVDVRGQDITRGTTERGQDLSAAIQRRGQDVQRDIARVQHSLTRRGQDLRQEIARAQTIIRQDEADVRLRAESRKYEEFQLDRMIRMAIEGREADKHGEEMWRRGFQLMLKSMGMSPENLMATGYYTRGVARGVDVMSPADWADPDKIPALTAVLQEMRGITSHARREFEGLRSIVAEFFKLLDQTINAR